MGYCHPSACTLCMPIANQASHQVCGRLGRVSLILFYFLCRPCLTLHNQLSPPFGPLAARDMCDHSFVAHVDPEVMFRHDFAPLRPSPSFGPLVVRDVRDHSFVACGDPEVVFRHDFHTSPTKPIIWASGRSGRARSLICGARRPRTFVRWWLGALPCPPNHNATLPLVRRVSCVIGRSCRVIPPPCSDQAHHLGLWLLGMHATTCLWRLATQKACSSTDLLPT